MNSLHCFSTIVDLFVLSEGAKAAQTDDHEPDPFRAVAVCSQIADKPVRLDCFDRNFAELQAAIDRKDVRLTSRAQARKTRRTLFGLPLPDLDLFGNDDEAESVSQIESTVATARLDEEGWVVTIAEGSTWRQIDGTPLAVEPRKGMTVVVKRGALHSYKMSIRNQPPIKVRRII